MTPGVAATTSATPADIMADWYEKVIEPYDNCLTNDTTVHHIQAAMKEYEHNFKQNNMRLFQSKLLASEYVNIDIVKRPSLAMVVEPASMKTPMYVLANFENETLTIVVLYLTPRRMSTIYLPAELSCKQVLSTIPVYDRKRIYQFLPSGKPYMFGKERLTEEDIKEVDYFNFCNGKYCVLAKPLRELSLKQLNMLNESISDPEQYVRPIDIGKE